MTPNGPKPQASLHFFNRSTGQIEEELVYGESFIKFLYGNPVAGVVADRLLTNPWVSRAYGWTQSLPQSRKKVAPFIQAYGIPMEQYEGTEFASFNDFFIRKFRPGMRDFTAKPSELAAFAEGRYLAFEHIEETSVFPVKGKFLTAEALLGSRVESKPFMGGPILIARLCPTDYHRFHYPDDGETLKTYRIGGKLHSVHPWALRAREDIYATNERQVSLLKTKTFGLLAYIEVGAICVGKIVQTHQERGFKRGDEKGYFLFGGSCVIVLGQSGAWRPADDLLEQSRNQRETLVKLGQCVGQLKG